MKDAQAALAAGGAASQDQLNQEILNAYENFGSNIDLSKLASQLGMTQSDLQNVLGPDAQKLAQENTDAGLSTQARLNQANQNATHQLLASLNKRGILNSGETAHDLDQQNLAYRQAQSDAYQKFLGYLQQYQQGYLTAQQTNAQSLAQAYGSAADRQVQENPGTAGVTATLDHIDAAGNAVYRGPDGSLYTANGSPYAAPQAAAPAPIPAQAIPPALANHAYQQVARSSSAFKGV